MKELQLDQARKFFPRQMFEMVAPNGDEYLLELALDTFDAVEEAANVSELNPDEPAYPIINLNAYTPQIPVYSFNGLKGLLSAIKRYRPCWTNPW